MRWQVQVWGLAETLEGLVPLGFPLVDGPTADSIWVKVQVLNDIMVGSSVVQLKDTVGWKHFSGVAGNSEGIKEG